MSDIEWVLVPRKPTSAMLSAAHFELCDKPFSNNSERSERVYAAMLASAPHPPAEAQAQGGGEVVAVVTLSEASAGEEYPTAPLQLTEAGRRLPAGEHQLYLAPPSAPVGEFVQHPSGDGTIARKSDPLNPLAVDEILAAMNRPSAPVGVESVVMAARNAENAIRNCAAAGQIGEGYVQYADDLRDAVQRLAQQPAAVQASDVGLSQGPDDIPRLLIGDREVATFPAGSWTEVCEAFDFGGYRNEQPAAVDELIDAARDYLDAEDQWNDDEEVENSEASRYRNLHVRRWKRLDAAVNALAQQPAAVDVAALREVSRQLRTRYAGAGGRANAWTIADHANDVAYRLVAWADSIDTALAAQQPAACTACNDRREVGGATPEGFETHPCPECAQQPAAEGEKYAELIYAVASKYPNESRHETALRYIRQAESADHGPAQVATQHQEPTTNDRRD